MPETSGYVKDCHLFVAAKNPQEKTIFLMGIEIDANVCVLKTKKMIFEA